jgi:PAS domain S-box-containing protein
VVVPDVLKSRLISDAAKAILPQFNVRSYLAMPIALRADSRKDSDGAPPAFAVLSIYTYGLRDLDEIEITSLHALVAQAAQTLEKVWLAQQLKENQDYFAGLLRSSTDAIVTTDRNGRIIFFNAGAENLLGFRAEEMQGQPVTKLVRNGMTALRKLLLHLLRNGGVQQGELEVITSDKETIPISLAISRVVSARGTVNGFLGIGKDISQRRAAELEIRRRSEELENFVYVISHNLKTPIVSIQGFANILQEELGPGLDNEHQHFLTRIRNNAAVMEKMILDLLEFSRLGRAPMKFEMVSVKDIVESVIDEISCLGQPPQCEFNLPNKSRGLPCIYADSSGLKTVFENLLNNAVKYRRREMPLRIEIGWEEKKRFHVFWVRDNGMGMDLAFHAKAFDLFQRGPNVGHIPGTGVGLAIVRRIIESHKGVVRLDSKPGEGTTIYFTLPKLETLPSNDSPPVGNPASTAKVNF